MEGGDLRVAAPICTPADVSELVQMPRATIYSWMRPNDNRPFMVHHQRTRRGGRSRTIPLVGLAEAASLRALRATLSMRKVVEAAQYMRNEYGDEYALASPRIVTDGLDAYLEEHGELHRLHDRQIPIREVIQDHLKPLIIAQDGYAEAFRVERLSPDIVIDPRYNAGAMSFARNRVPVFAVAGALMAGEDDLSVARDFVLESQEVRSIRDNLDWVSRLT